MKQMNVRAEAALLEVARRHHTTVEEVRREIRLAMAMAMCNPAPAARKIWGEIPCDGNVLTPEDLITYAAMRCREGEFLKFLARFTGQGGVISFSSPFSVFPALVTAWADSPHGAADRRVRALRCPP